MRHLVLSGGGAIRESERIIEQLLPITIGTTGCGGENLLYVEACSKVRVSEADEDSETGLQ